MGDAQSSGKMQGIVFGLFAMRVGFSKEEWLIEEHDRILSVKNDATGAAMFQTIAVFRIDQ